jgi:hypothetical protein
VCFYDSLWIEDNAFSTFMTVIEGVIEFRLILTALFTYETDHFSSEPPQEKHAYEAHPMDPLVLTCQSDLPSPEPTL